MIDIGSHCRRYIVRMPDQDKQQGDAGDDAVAGPTDTAAATEEMPAGKQAGARQNTVSQKRRS